MRERWWSLLLLLLSMGSLGFASYSLASGRAVHAAAVRLAAQNSEIPQPSEWVPFSADVLVTHVDGRDPVRGRFYRDSHGCVRLETGPEGKVAVISISNVPDISYYRWSSRLNRWTKGPMALPPDGWKPMRRRTAIRGLDKHPTSVEVRKGKSYNLRSDSGLVAYRYTSLGGTFSLQVPDLNFFDVLKQNLEGRRESYYNIEVGEQPEELFVPPAGVALTYSQKLSGIVSQPAEHGKDHLQELIHGRQGE